MARNLQRNPIKLQGQGSRFRASSAWAIGLLLLGLVGCASNQADGNNPAADATDPATAQTAQSADLPQVVATTTVLCDLTKQLAQDTVALTCLMQPAQDPHVYTPTPSDRKALEDADLVLYGGYDYEPSLIKIIGSTSTSAPKIAVYEAAVPKPLLGEEHHHEGEAHTTEEEAHAHEQENHAHEEEAHAHEETEALVPDPHVWHNAANGTAIVEVIQAQLAQLVPDQANLYETNATALTQQLTDLDRWIKTQVATVPAANRKLVTTHEALGYYAEAYGFELEGTIEGVSTEEKPSAARLSELVAQLKTSQVPTIFVETTTNPKQLETVAQEANVQIAEQPLFIEGPGDANSAAPTYQQMLITNTCTIVEGLGGQCDRASVSQ